MLTNYKPFLLSTFLVVLCVVCVSAQSTASEDRLPPFGTACAEGVVSVETQENAPLQLTIEKSACGTTQTASVRFKAKNVSPKAIVEFDIRSLETYEQHFEDGGGMRASELVLKPNETYDRGFMGGGVQTKAGGLPVGKLKTYVLTVWSVTFDDGTKWEREPTKEVFNSKPNP